MKIDEISQKLIDQYISETVGHNIDIMDSSHNTQVLLEAMVKTIVNNLTVGYDKKQVLEATKQKAISKLTELEVEAIEKDDAKIISELVNSKINEEAVKAYMNIDFEYDSQYDTVCYIESAIRQCIEKLTTGIDANKVKEQAILDIKQKLTPEECEILGITKERIGA